MRILPVHKSNSSAVNKNNLNAAIFERKNNFAPCTRRQYTGQASVDLAYASLFDNAIAKDLKLMGLI